MSFQDVVEDASPTLMRLFSMISEKSDLSLSAALMANIITSVVTNRPTSLQVALGVVTGEKSLIELLYDFGVTSSYDDILRFKAYAAHAASQSWELRGISNSDLGLVQTVADNFDANISSQNGPTIHTCSGNTSHSNANASVTRQLWHIQYNHMSQERGDEGWNHTRCTHPAV